MLHAECSKIVKINICIFMPANIKLLKLSFTKFRQLYCVLSISKTIRLTSFYFVYNKHGSRSVKLNEH